MSRVLIVEDVEFVALGLAARLHEIADEVDIALTWDRALKMTALRDYAVIAIDLALPDSPREQTLCHLQDLHAFRPHVRIVVMSGLPLTVEERESAFAHGACLCITKTDRAFQDAIISLASPARGPSGASAIALLLGLARLSRHV